MAQDNLVQYLPSDLDAALKKSMSPGEEVLVSLPGALGEALAATNKRLTVVREKSPAEGIEVYSYQLPDVTGVIIGSSTTGGMLTIQSSGSEPEDQRTVFFASYDKSKFESAADRIKGFLSVAHAIRAHVAVNTPVAVVPASASTGSLVVSMPACPSCGKSVGEMDAFCGACGAGLKEICQICSGTMPVGAAFCVRCGSEAKPASTECRSCGARINTAVMSYCPQCGTSTSPKCASCGGTIVPGWPRCRFCGREIGSEGVLGRGFSMQVERDMANRVAATSVTGLKDEEEAAELEEPKTNSAAEHNRRGAELFDDDKVEEAIEEFRRAVVLEPDNSSYHCNLGAAYDEAGQMEDARREYERTLELNSNDITALLYLGYLLNENEEPERAAGLWKRLIEVAPGTPEAEEAEQNLRVQKTL